VVLKRRRRRDEPPPPTVTVTSQLGIVPDKKAAGALFNAILASVQKANARVAREKEEAVNGRRRAS
jgi:hypothetical protein